MKFDEFLSYVIPISIVAGYFASLVGKKKDLEAERRENRRKAYELSAREAELLTREENVCKKEKRISAMAEGLVILEKENLKRAPWLAEMYADFLQLFDEALARDLRAKSRPAIRASDSVRLISNKKREAESKYRLLKYQLNIYENVFPQLKELKEVDVHDVIKILDAQGLPPSIDPHHASSNDTTDFSARQRRTERH